MTLEDELRDLKLKLARVELEAKEAEQKLARVNQELNEEKQRRENAERETEKFMSRTRLSKKAELWTFDKLITELETADCSPYDVGNEYCKSTGKKSDAYSNDVSSIGSISTSSRNDEQKGRLPYTTASNLRLSQLKGINLDSLVVNEKELAKHICSLLFNGDESRMTNFLSEFSHYLQLLRNFFYWNSSSSTTSESGLNFVFCLFMLKFLLICRSCC